MSEMTRRAEVYWDFRHGHGETEPRGRKFKTDAEAAAFATGLSYAPTVNLNVEAFSVSGEPLSFEQAHQSSVANDDECEGFIK